MTRQIALLRGINVGGQKKVPMARLRELMEGLGYEDVSTYVQSGNVVFSSPKKASSVLAAEIENALEAEFGFDVSVLVRSRDELAAVVKANPLKSVAKDRARYHVLFLSGKVAAKRLDTIEPKDFEPQRFVVAEREIYMWTPDGIGRSKLAQALSDKRLGVTVTGRNWRTVEKLLALAG